MARPSVDDGPHDWSAAKSHQELLDMIKDANTGVISDRGGALRGASGTLTDISAQLNSNVQNLEWTGPAADSFRDWAGKLTTATTQLADYALAAAPALEDAGTALGTAKAMPPLPGKELDTLQRYTNQGPPLSPTDQAKRKALDPSYVTTQDAQDAQAKIDSDRQDAVDAMTSLAGAYDESTSQLNAQTPPLFPPTPTAVMGPPPQKTVWSGEGGASFGGGSGGGRGADHRPVPGPGEVRVAPVQPDPRLPVTRTPIPGPGPQPVPPTTHPEPQPGPTPQPTPAPKPVTPPSTGIDGVSVSTVPPLGTTGGGLPPQGGLGGPPGGGGLGAGYSAAGYVGGIGSFRGYGGRSGTSAPNTDEGISGGVSNPGPVSGRSQLGANAIGAEEGEAGAAGATGRGSAGGMMPGGAGGFGGARGGVGGGIGRGRGLVSAEGGEVGGTREPSPEGEFTPAAAACGSVPAPMVRDARPRRARAA